MKSIPNKKQRQQWSPWQLDFPTSLDELQMAAALIAGGNRLFRSTSTDTLFVQWIFQGRLDRLAAVFARGVCVSFPNVSLVVPFPLQGGK